MFEQETKVEKLKSSLDDAMSAHKKAMDDNEKLLNDLKKANSTIRVSPLILVPCSVFFMRKTFSSSFKTFNKI